MAAAAGTHTARAAAELAVALANMLEAALAPGRAPSPDGMPVFSSMLTSTVPGGGSRHRRQTGERSDQPARLVEGQRVVSWREPSANSTSPLQEGYDNSS